MTLQQKKTDPLSLLTSSTLTNEPCAVLKQLQKGVMTLDLSNPDLWLSPLAQDAKRAPGEKRQISTAAAAATNGGAVLKLPPAPVQGGSKHTGSSRPGVSSPYSTVKAIQSSGGSVRVVGSVPFSSTAPGASHRPSTSSVSKRPVALATAFIAPTSPPPPAGKPGAPSGGSTRSAASTSSTASNQDGLVLSTSAGRLRRCLKVLSQTIPPTQGHALAYEVLLLTTPSTLASSRIVAETIRTNMTVSKRKHSSFLSGVTLPPGSKPSPPGKHAVYYRFLLLKDLRPSAFPSVTEFKAWVARQATLLNAVVWHWLIYEPPPGASAAEKGRPGSKSENRRSRGSSGTSRSSADSSGTRSGSSRKKHHKKDKKKSAPADAGPVDLSKIKWAPPPGSGTSAKSLSSSEFRKLVEHQLTALMSCFSSSPANSPSMAGSPKPEGSFDEASYSKCLEQLSASFNTIYKTLGISQETGYPFGVSVRFYSELITTCFQDSLEPEKVSPDAPEIIGALEDVRLALGISQQIHELCFLSALFAHYIKYSEPSILTAISKSLSSVVSLTSPTSPKSPSSPSFKGTTRNLDQANYRELIMSHLLTSAEDMLSDYHRTFATSHEELGVFVTHYMAIVQALTTIAPSVLGVGVGGGKDGALASPRGKKGKKKDTAWERAGERRLAVCLRSSAQRQYSRLAKPLIADFTAPNLIAFVDTLMDELTAERDYFLPRVEKAMPDALHVVFSEFGHALALDVHAMFRRYESLDQELLSVLPKLQAWFDFLTKEVPTIDKSALPDFAGTISPLIAQWLAEQEQVFLRNVDGALALEAWEPISAEIVHSSSVVDIFSMFQQTLPFLYMLSFPDLVEFYIATMANNIDRTIVHYIRSIMLDVQRLGPLLPPTPRVGGEAAFAFIGKPSSSLRRGSAMSAGSSSSNGSMGRKSTDGDRMADARRRAAAAKEAARAKMEAVKKGEGRMGRMYHKLRQKVKGEGSPEKARRNSTDSKGSDGPTLEDAIVSRMSPQLKAELKRESLDKLCVRLNNIHYTRQQLTSLQHEIRAKFVAAFGEEAAAAHDGPISPTSKSGDKKKSKSGGDKAGGLLFSEMFSKSFTAIAVAASATADYIAARVAFYELRPALIDGLYTPNVASVRLVSVLDAVDPVLGVISELVVADGTDDLVTSVLHAFVLGMEHVLLDGGPNRWYELSDHDLIMDDLLLLQEFFMAKDESGIPQGLRQKAVLGQTTYLRNLIANLFEEESETLIEKWNTAPPTHNAHPVTQRNIFRVLAHRRDAVAINFIRTLHTCP